MNRLKGKVALVTGAARGQGRSHAVALADEGADVILLDICADIESNTYPLSRTEDLDETIALVEKSGRRAVSAEVDVRDRVSLEAAIDTGVGELGGLDVVVANAGICPLGAGVVEQAFFDTYETNFVGVVNTINAGIRHLAEGGSVIATGSIAGLVDDFGYTSGTGVAGLGGAGYGLAKKMIRDYTKTLAMVLASRRIRVNAIHPTNVNTDMLHNSAMYRLFRPDLSDPTREDAELTFPVQQAMPVPYVETADVSHAVVYLASDESRFVTGQQLFVDAGAGLKLGV
jgi:SDR family mycofactocin-dependent oxidoreductase